jgi:2-dehydropantoate 2-reductase
MTTEKQRIIFIGAGAVGSYLGGWLDHLGHDVTIVDPWAEQVEKIRADGLLVEGPHEPFTAHPKMFHLHENELVARQEKFDIGFVAVKAYDTRWAANFIDPFVKDDGYIVSAQNCWTDPMVADAVGAERAVGMVMSSISVAMWEAGKVERPGKTRQRDVGHDVFRAGEHDGSESQRTRDLIEMLDPIDAGKTTTNLWGERWAKLSQNSMGNPVVSISDMGMADLNKEQRGRELQMRLAAECARVGLAQGIKVEKFGGVEPQMWADSDKGDVYEELDGVLAAKTKGANWRPSMGQDVFKGRPTEINQMNGYVVEKADELGIDVPVNRAIVEAIKAIDAGTLKPAKENIDAVLARAGY